MSHDSFGIKVNRIFCGACSESVSAPQTLDGTHTASPGLLAVLSIVEVHVAVAARRDAASSSDRALVQVLDAISLHAERTAGEFGLPATVAVPDRVVQSLGECVVLSMRLVDGLADLARVDEHSAAIKRCETWLDQRSRLVAAWSAGLDAGRAT